MSAAGAPPAESPPPSPEATPLYRAGRLLLHAELLLWHRMRVEERQHLPRTGGVLLASNHQSMLDIGLIAAAARRHVAFVARDNLAQSRVLARVMRSSGAVLVRRGRPDRAALRSMVERLRAGDCVAVFPEGTRTEDGNLGDFLPGALFAARAAGVPIVPAGIRGALDALPRGRLVPRPRRVAIRFGPPIDSNLPDALERARAAIADRIGSGRYDSVPARRKNGQQGPPGPESAFELRNP